MTSRKKVLQVTEAGNMEAWVRDRNAAKAALEKSNNILQSVINSTPDVVYVKDIQGRYVLANSTVARWLEKPIEEIIGKDDAELFPPEIARKIMVADKTIMTTGETLTYEEVVPEKEIMRTLLTTKCPWRDEQGNIIGMVGLSRDISDRKMAELALSDREQFLASIYDGVEQVIFVLDVEENGDFRYAGMNFAGARLTGIPACFWRGKTPLEVMGEDQGAAVQQNYINCIFAATTISYEECLKFQGADTYWLTTLTPLRDENGRISRIIGTSNNITSRKQTELALRDREQFLASIYDAVEHPIFVVDVTSDGGFRYAGMNPAGLRVSSTSIEQVCNKTPEQVYPEAIAASMRQRYIDCLEAGASISYEEKMIFFGAETWWNTTLTPLRNLEGRIDRIIGMTLNITARKQAEQALQESERFIQQIAEATPNVLYVYDLVQNRNVYANRELFSTLEYTIEEVQKMGTAAVVKLMHPEDFAKFIEYIKQLNKAKDGEIFEFEYRMRHKNGSWRWLISRDSVFSRSADGKPLQLIGAASDITARKKAEAALQQSEAQQRKLAQREALLNRLANRIRNSLDINTILETTVHEIRALLQLDSCLFIWYLPAGKDNRATQPAWHVAHEANNSNLPALLGYYLTDGTTKTQAAIAQLEIIRIDDIEALTNPIERQFFLTLGYKSLLDVPLQTASGAIGIIACGSCTATRSWKDDEVELLLAVTNQLAIALDQAELYAQSQNSTRLAEEKATQLQVALQELQQTQTQLIQSEKMSSLGQMVAGIAHEINNPTSFIYSNIQPATDYIKDLFNLLALYQEHYPHPVSEIQDEIEAIELDFLVEDLPKLLNSMKMGATRIRDIVRSLRTFSRLDEAAMKQVDIHDGIDSTLMILEHRLKKVGSFSGIQVIKNYGKLPLVECYAGQLNQVFMNILDNAIDALEEVMAFPGTVGTRVMEESSNYQSPTINISTSVVDNYQVLIQIADNGSGMTEEVRRRLFDPFFTTKPVGSGTGLGMSISYQIIEKHGGQLQCISSPGKGAELLIYIPIKT